MLGELMNNAKKMEFICNSIKKYLKEVNKEIYQKEMIKAGKDKEYLKRTLKCQNDFKSIS